jgi:hypothetical protein
VSVIAAWRSLVRSALVGEGEGSGDLTSSGPAVIGRRMIRAECVKFFLFLMVYRFGACGHRH